jgi:tetratricopeptide (TPR) repeat protein
MRLSVFQGGWTLELASEVCGFDGLDEFDVLDGLSGVVNKSLVHTVSGADGLNRYRRLETVRQYAREKLLDSGASEAVHDRHLDAFTRLVERAEPHLRGHRQVEWLDRLEEELDNLRAALEWALEGDALKGLRLVTSSYWFWHIRGYRVEGESWLRLLQERLGEQADVDLALLATARARQAYLQLVAGRRGTQVTRIAEEALALSKGLGDAGKPIQVMALRALAWNAGYLGQHAISYKLRRQCLEMAEELGDRFLIAESLQNLTAADLDQAKAREYAERNLALRQELGDLDGLQTAQGIMGRHHFWSGDISQSRLLYEESIHTARTAKNRWGLLQGHCHLGRILYESGEPDQAIEHFLQGLTIAQDLGEQVWVIWVLNALGYAFGLKQDWLKAEWYFRQAIDISRTNQIIFAEVSSCISLAEVAWTLGDVELAVQYYQAMADMGQGQDDLPLEGLTTYAAGKAALLRGELRSAGEFLRAALKDCAERDYLNDMGPCLESLAVCAVGAGRFERAVRLHGITASRRWLKHLGRMPWLVSYDLDGLLAPARATLGEAEYAHLYAEGQAMTLEQAVAYALEVDDE